MKFRFKSKIVYLNHQILLFRMYETGSAMYVIRITRISNAPTLSSRHKQKRTTRTNLRFVIFVLLSPVFRNTFYHVEFYSKLDTSVSHINRHCRVCHIGLLPPFRTNQTICFPYNIIPYPHTYIRTIATDFLQNKAQRIVASSMARLVVADSIDHVRHCSILPTIVPDARIVSYCLRRSNGLPDLSDSNCRCRNYRKIGR